MVGLAVNLKLKPDLQMTRDLGDSAGRKQGRNKKSLPQGTDIYIETLERTDSVAGCTIESPG